MNFVPFKLETKRKEKKEVINLGKMGEEERELINLINSTWEEMALQPSGAKRDRMEEETWVPPGSLALPSTQMPGVGGEWWGGRWAWARGFCWPCGHPLAMNSWLEFLPQPAWKFVGRGRECSQLGQHPVDPVSRESEVQSLRWAGCVPCVTPSSLTLLVVSSFPSVSLGFSNSLKNFTLMKKRFCLLPNQSRWGSDTLCWV